MIIDASFTHRGISLVMTCGGCPEQYDAYNGKGQKVGYFRLRHGNFTVDYGGCGGETIYRAHPDGDGLFEAYERDHFLREGIDALKAAIASGDRQ